MTSTAKLRRGRKSRDFQERRERFDTAWQGTATPVIEEFLPATETAEVHGYSRKQLLVELVEIDLECRWKAGYPRSHFDSTEDHLPSKPRVEDYLARFPELGSADEVPLDLVIQEYKARSEAGEIVEHDEFIDRFPSHADQLRQALRDVDTNMSEPTARFVRCPQCHSSIAVPELTAAAVEVVTCACGEKVSIIDARAGDQREGELVDDYQLIRWLGRGSFANVWLAFDQHLERHVALKIPYNRRKKEERPDLIRNEARIVAGLKHPNIVQVYELGQGDNEYIASEYIKGHNLEVSLRTSPRAPEDTAAMCRKVAEALHYLHGEGVVHRDVKPSNILFDEHDEPHLTDFGLARREDENIVLSSAGELIGTVAYMSPKQAAGKGNQADARSDVFSLGIVMYEMLAGTLPFHGDRLTILNNIQNEEPVRILKHAPNTPRDLQTICFKCLEKAPEMRYATAGALADDLGRYLRGEPIHARPASRVERLIKWAKRHPARAIAAATSFAAAAAIVVAVGLAVHQSIEAERQLREDTIARANEIRKLESKADELVKAIEVQLSTLKNTPTRSPTEFDHLDTNFASLRDVISEGGGDLAHIDDVASVLSKEAGNARGCWNARRSNTIRLEELRKCYRGAMLNVGWLVFPSADSRPDWTVTDHVASESWEPSPSASADPSHADDASDTEAAASVPDVSLSQRPHQAPTSTALFPTNRSDAIQATESCIREGLAAIGVIFSDGDKAAIGSTLLWDDLARQGVLDPSVDFKGESREDAIVDVKRMAYELVLLDAEIAFQGDGARMPRFENWNARQALERLELASTLALIGDAADPAKHAGANGTQRTSGSAEYCSFYRAREIYQAHAEAREPADWVGESVPEDARDYDHFLEGCRKLKLLDPVGRKDFAEALAHFESAYRKNSRHLWARYFIALCHARDRDPRAADTLLTDCVDQMEGFPWVFALRGIVRGRIYRTGRADNRWALESAIQDFNEAERLVGGDNTVDGLAGRLRVAILMSRGALYFDAHSSEGGEDWLDRAADDFAAVSSIDSRGYYQLALVRRAQQRDGDAFSLLGDALRQIEATGGGVASRSDEIAAIRMTRAEILLSRQDYVGATRELDAAIAVAEREPSGLARKWEAAARVNLAWTLGFAPEGADRRRAMQNCEKVIVLSNAGDGADAAATTFAVQELANDAHLLAAFLWLQEAKDQARKTLAHRSTIDDERGVRAARDRLDEANRKAMECLDAYLSAGVQDPSVYEMRANLHVRMAEPDRDLARAESDYAHSADLYREAALREKNQDRRSRWQADEMRLLQRRGVCLMKLGEADQAIEALDRAIDDLGDMHFATHIARGFARVLAAQTKEKADFQRALADAEWVALLTDDAYELYEAAGIYALAAGKVAYAKGPLGYNFKPWGKRSLALLRRALKESAAIDALGRYTHPKAVKIRQFGGSPTFRALQYLDEYVPLMGEYARPSHRSRGVAPPKLASGREGDTR